MSTNPWSGLRFRARRSDSIAGHGHSTPKGVVLFSPKLSLRKSQPSTFNSFYQICSIANNLQIAEEDRETVEQDRVSGKKISSGMLYRWTGISHGQKRRERSMLI